MAGDNMLGDNATFAFDDWQLLGPGALVPTTGSTEFQGVPQPSSVANTGDASGAAAGAISGAGGSAAGHMSYGIGTANLPPGSQPAFHALLWMVVGTVIIAYASYVSRTVASVGD